MFFSVVVALVFLGVILLTIAARPERGQSFMFITYSDIGKGADYNTVMTNVSDGNVLSDNVVDYTGVTANANYEGYVIGMRFAMSKGNFLVAGDMPVYNENKQLFTESSFASVTKSYANYMAEYSKWFADCEAYLDTFYTGGWKDGTIDKEKVLTSFRERVLGQKAYRTEAKVQAGLSSEVKRIEKLRNDLIAVYDYIEQGVLSLRYIEVEKNDIKYAGNYGLTVNGDAVPDLKKFITIYGYDKDGNYFETVNSITFVVFPWSERKGCAYAQWESLGLIRYLIDRYSA